MINTSVTPIIGAYKTSLNNTLEVIGPLGMFIYMSPLPIALNEHLSAAVIGFGGIDNRLKVDESV